MQVPSLSETAVLAVLGSNFQLTDYILDLSSIASVVGTFETCKKVSFT